MINRIQKNNTKIMTNLLIISLLFGSMIFALPPQETYALSVTSQMNTMQGTSIGTVTWYYTATQVGNKYSVKLTSATYKNTSGVTVTFPSGASSLRGYTNGNPQSQSASITTLFEGDVYNGQTVTICANGQTAYSCTMSEKPKNALFFSVHWGTMAGYAQSLYDSYMYVPVPGTVKKYSLRYNPNTPPGAATTGTMPLQTINDSIQNYALQNAYITPGYRFVGWDRVPSKGYTEALDIGSDKGAIPSGIFAQYSDSAVIDVYAVWRPISDSEAQIYVGKIVDTNGPDPATDTYQFKLEPLEGHMTDNADTAKSGQQVAKADMPMPEGTDKGQNATITVGGLSTASPGTLRFTDAVINFTDPGWYQYKASEIKGQNTSIRYDSSSYIITIYVKYKYQAADDPDTANILKVANVTAYHNRPGMDNEKPDTSDISGTTDNNGIPASDVDGSAFTASEKDKYGKNAIGLQAIEATFFNSENIPDKRMNDLHITKNLKGNLGDITKKFEYTLTLTGAAANTTYPVSVKNAESVAGFTGSGTSYSVTTDASGNAGLEFRLVDDAYLEIRNLPTNTKFEVTETKSDHNPSYRVYLDDETAVKSGRSFTGNSLSTGQITMSEAGHTYYVVFDNLRDLAVNTGVIVRGTAIAVTAIILILTATFMTRKNRKRRIAED